jgi:hypothetical protein
MNQKTTLYALVGLLVLAILIIGALIYKEQNAPVPPLDVPVAEEVVTTESYSAIAPDEELLLQEQVAPLIAAGDMVACEQVQNAMYKAVCINNIALKQVEETKNIALCQKLDDILVSRSQCEESTLMRIVSESKSIADCAKGTITDVVARCEQSFYEVVAASNNDAASCDLNPDRVAADNCFNTISLRKQIDTFFSATSTPGLECSGFRGETMKQECEKFNVALTANDYQSISLLCADSGTAQMRPLCSALMF